MATPADFDALSGARHPDPFSILGPHVEAGAVVIRAYHPSARRVDIVRDGGTVEAVRHAGGIFEAVFPDAGAIFDYRIRITYPDGQAMVVDDPYRYGRVITEYDVYLFSQGKHTRIYDKLGAHPMRIGDVDGVHFAVWAPNADRVSVVGDFNAWDGRVHPMRSARRRPASGRSSSPACAEGQRYKFEIRSSRARRAAAEDRSVRLRVRGAAAAPPVIVTGLDYEWQDARVDDRSRRRRMPGSTSRWRSTKSTSARGRTCPRSAIAI